MLTVRASAYTAILIITPESSTDIGVGASACASGSQGWNGAIPALVPKPTTRNATAISAVAGGDQVRHAAHLADQQRLAAGELPGRRRRRVDQHAPEEREGDADRQQHEVLVAGLERPPVPVEGDQQAGGERGRLDRDVEHDDVVGDAPPHHGGEEPEEQPVERRHRRSAAAAPTRVSRPGCVT